MLKAKIGYEDGQMLKQYVWGTQYIDELVQVGYNQDPQNADSHHQYYNSMENECEYYFYPMQDANFNIMGIVNQDGRLVVRYEYTPYGQRTVYSHGVVEGDVDGDGFVGTDDLNAVNTQGVATGPDPADLNGDGYIGTDDLNIVLGNWNAGHADTNDKAITYPTLASARVTQHGTERAGSALCEVGHQGLFHDEEFGSRGGLIYNRARMRSTRLGRWLQREPLGYVDGMSMYQYVRSQPIDFVDWNGRQTSRNPTGYPGHPGYDPGMDNYTPPLPPPPQPEPIDDLRKWICEHGGALYGSPYRGPMMGTGNSNWKVPSDSFILEPSTGANMWSLADSLIGPQRDGPPYPDGQYSQFDPYLPGVGRTMSRNKSYMRGYWNRHATAGKAGGLEAGFNAYGRLLGWQHGFDKMYVDVYDEKGYGSPYIRPLYGNNEAIPKDIFNQKLLEWYGESADELLDGCPCPETDSPQEE